MRVYWEICLSGKRKNFNDSVLWFMAGNWVSVDINRALSGLSKRSAEMPETDIYYLRPFVLLVARDGKIFLGRLIKLHKSFPQPCKTLYTQILISYNSCISPSFVYLPFGSSYYCPEYWLLITTFLASRIFQSYERPLEFDSPTTVTTLIVNG